MISHIVLVGTRRFDINRSPMCFPWLGLGRSTFIAGARKLRVKGSLATPIYEQGASMVDHVVLVGT